MARVFGRVLKATGALLAYLVAFDVVGVVLCLVLDLFSLGFGPELASYAVWFVLGVFCGVLYLQQGGALLSNVKDGDWLERDDAPRVALLVIALVTATLSLLSLCFYWILWRYDPSEGPFVPGSAAYTLIFFVSILASMVLLWHTAKKPSAGPKA